MDDRRPWWREPMVLLMIGLPLASVFAGVSLLVTAVRSGGADEVTDDVLRTAQIQVSELGPDARAASLKLSAILSLDQSTATILPASGEFARNEALVLTLGHPTDATQDRQLTLEPSQLGWQTVGDLRSTHDWILQLGPSDGQWRLRGRMKAGQLAARLAPAVAGE
jgi:hypothetical protein